MEMREIVRIFLCIFLISICDCFVKSEKFVGILQDLVDQDVRILDISDECKEHLLIIRNGLSFKKLWAIKLLDASSHIESDFIWGNNIQIGSPDSCELVTIPNQIPYLTGYVPRMYSNLTTITPPMSVAYRSVHVRHQSKLQVDFNSVEKNIIDFGFCMPTSCGDEDSYKLFGAFFNNHTFVGQTIWGPNLEVVQTKLLKIDSEFFYSPFVIGFMLIISAIISLSIVQLIIDFTKDNESKRLPDDDSAENTMSHKYFLDILKCFSITENTKSIIISENKDSLLPSMHGLRAVLMLVYISGHMYIFGASSCSNMQKFLIVGGNILYQPLVTLHLTIETFFVLGAILCSYYFFKISKATKIKNYFLTYIQVILYRAARVTPPYWISVFLTVFINRLMKRTSVYYLMNDNEDKCERLWWQNLLYVNNFVPLDEMCALWSWYLAADFQCFLIATFCLFLFHKRQEFGIICIIGICIGCTLLTGYFGWKLNYTLTQDAFYRTSNYLYTPFWSRMTGYFIGIYAGYFLYKNSCILNLNKHLISIFWTLAIIILLLLVYGNINQGIDPITAFFYTAFGKTAYAASVSWIIVACSTGNGGFIGKILSSNIFPIFSRLSYCAYLLNPPIIILITMLNNRPIYFDFSMMSILAIGFVGATFAVSFPYSILFEMPFKKLAKLVVLRKND